MNDRFTRNLLNKILHTPQVANYRRDSIMGVPAYQKAQEAERAEKSREALLRMSKEDAEGHAYKVGHKGKQLPKLDKSKQVDTGTKAVDNLKRWSAQQAIKPVMPMSTSPKRPTKRKLVEDARDSLKRNTQDRFDAQANRDRAHRFAEQIANDTKFEDMPLTRMSYTPEKGLHNERTYKSVRDRQEKCSGTRDCWCDTCLASDGLSDATISTVKQIHAIDASITLELAIEMALR
jgi:hypothetical protein